MSGSSSSTEEVSGYIRVDQDLDDCGEAMARIKQLIENARVYFPGGISGFVVSADEPGPDDRDKVWIKTSDCGDRFFCWSTTCGKWCATGGIPGERITRERINDTVAEDLEEYYPCFWQLADGSNVLGVDLRSDEPAVFGQFDLALPQPTYCITEFSWRDISSGTVTVYAMAAVNHGSAQGLVNALNLAFDSPPIDLEAELENGCIKVTSPLGTAEFVGGEDCAGNPLIVG